MSTTIATPTIPPAAAAELPLHTRLVLTYRHSEVWQGTWGELRYCLRRQAAAIAQALAAEDTKPSFAVPIEDLADMNPQHWRPGVMFPTEPLALKRAHYYIDQNTGSRYTNADRIQSWHYHRGGPLKVSFYPSGTRTPVIILSQAIGNDAEFTPDQLERLAKTLLTVAADARKYPMGKRSYFKSTRGYDTHA